MKADVSGKKIKEAELLIFDLDGTIIKLDCRWDKLKEELRLFCINKYKLNIDFSSLNDGVTKITALLKKEERKNFFDIIERYELKGLSRACPISHTINFIKRNKNKKMAIFSANTKKAIAAALRKLKIKSYFQLIIGKEDVEHQKPHPEGLYSIMNRLKIPASEMIYIGDRNSDFVMGRKAKVLTFNIKDLTDC